MVDAQQVVRARYDYDPYGRQTKVSGDRESQFGYTGHFWHAQSGLNLTYFRAYDPNLGRWISRDPLGEAGGINTYVYAINNPINLVDEYGDVPDKWVPKYGNWGGPDWSGGWHPSEHGGVDGPGAPIDSMDSFFKKHDQDYGKARCTPKDPNSDCNKIKDPVARARCEAKRQADWELWRGLNGLPQDPRQWPQVPPDIDAARKYRDRALNWFPWPKN